MAIRKILTLEQPVLRAKAKKVSRFDTYLERLVADMFETMRAAPGVGLAAPQIGESMRVLVAEYEDEHVALVNPEIIKSSEETELGTEGCLSIPGYVGDNVPRALKVTVKARDPKGKEIRIKAEGWFARILQHEIDHLDGILFIDRIGPEDVRRVTEDEIIEEGEVVEKEPDGGAHVEKNGRAPRPAAKSRGGQAAGRKARSSRAAKQGGAR
jgi:peptide deformylase